MYLLKRVHLVQFFLFQAQTLELDATTAVIAPNGAGKSALLDALQIVMLGGDRNRIRFNAQAGGSHRARTIRDYCLGVYRSGEEGRTRRTATTYITLVFEDQDSDGVLTAGIALGASADEPDHRMHGLYLLPDVALTLEDHLERVDGSELPLAWAGFRELAVRRCKTAGSKAEVHSTSDRFIKDLLLRLRPGPTAFLDPVAYRKAFQNALNLQRVDDVDLFVRTLVAEDRPTEIARFRGLLEGFRQIKEKIEQVARRIDEAEQVELQYRKVATQATRAASCRALAAEYERDLHHDKLDAAETAVKEAERGFRSKQRDLQQSRSERDSTREEYDRSHALLQGTRGYNEQSAFDQVADRDRAELAQVKQELIRQAGYVRDQLRKAATLELSTIDAAAIDTAIAPWHELLAHLSALAPDADIGLAPEQLHATVLQAVASAAPVIDAVAAHARMQHAAYESVRSRAEASRRNQQRLSAGQAELRADVIRMVSYLHDAGIPAQPVCDLVKVVDLNWQPAIEAYLRSHVEALLIPAEHEEQAVRLYRSLQGGRSVYGVKLALTSQARSSRGKDAAPAAGTVAALLAGDNEDALGYLRRQLGELRCVETEAEVVRARQGLSRDGLVAKGGGIERLRLPPASELKIGASDNRERRRLLREEMEQAEQDARTLEAAWKSADACANGLARIGSGDDVAQAVHDSVLRHRQAESRYRALKDSQAASADPDLLRISEQVRALHERRGELELLVERLIGETAIAEGKVGDAQAALQALQDQEQAIARRATDAFAHVDVDPNAVEQQREDLEGRYPELLERYAHALERARRSDDALGNLLPEAWRGLAQYDKDHGLALDLEPQDWRGANALLHKEIAHLKGTELVQYQQHADEAYAAAIEAFRANVVSALYDNFTRLKYQINTLNRTLKRSPAFSNNERYQFHYEVAPEFRELHRFINKAADVGETDTLFGTAGEVPEAFRDIIEDRGAGRGGAPSPLDDYRRFFNFEVDIRQDDRVIGTLSERMRSGSGGEHRAPLYVIAGAALAAAYGKTESQQGGIGVIMLDEFGDKIDAQNARATTNYLRSLGLQLILAAPDTAQGTLTGVLDSYIELFRDGDLLQLERVQVKPAGRELLESDQFLLHPELLAQEIARIEAGQVPA